MITPTVLIRVFGPDFIAGVLIDPRTDRCVRAAPILHWCRDKPRDWILARCAARGWPTEIITAQD